MKTCLLDLKPVLRHSCSFFSTLEVFVASIEGANAIYGQKLVFAGFETGFMASAILSFNTLEVFLRL